MGNNKQTTMTRVRSILLLSAVLFAPSQANIWDDINRKLTQVNNGLSRHANHYLKQVTVIVSVRNVPEHDKKSGTDLYFKLRNDETGEIVHTSNVTRDIPGPGAQRNRQVTSKATFQGVKLPAGSDKHDWTIIF